MMPSARIELRTAEPADIPSIRRIWRESFGDEDEYIDFFLRRRFVPDNTPVLTADGKVAAQLFLLPAQLRACGKIFPIDYLFAAATDPACRRKGYMAQLLSFAEALSRAHGKAAIVLLPGEETLYRYYARYGYQTAFARRVWRCTRDDLQALFVPAAPADAVQTLADWMHRTDGVVWDADALRYALDEYRTFRGSFAAAGQAFAAVSGEDAVLLASPDAVGQGCDLLLHLSDAPVLTVTLPPDAPLGTRQDGGMIRFLRDAFPIQDAGISFAME